MDTLENLGFHVKDAIDGKHDNLGGLIETEITAIEQLETDDLQEIKDELYKVADDLGVFCQWSQFYRFDESGTKGI